MRSMVIVAAVLLPIISTIANSPESQDRRKEADSQSDVRRIGQALVGSQMLIAHWRAFEDDTNFKPLIDELSSNIANFEYSSTTFKPTTEPDDWPADDFTRDFWRRVQATPEAIQRLIKIESTYRYLKETQQHEFYQAVRAGKSCIACHRIISHDTTVAEGDVLKVIKVTWAD